MIRKLTICALLVAQVSTAVPASAAELTDGRTQQAGAFAGFRLRLALDGDARRRPLRAGLAVAPTIHSQSLRGETRTRIGEGLELGIVGDGPVRVSLAGTPVSRLVQGPAQGDGRRVRASTGEWIAIGAGAVVVVLGVAYLGFMEWIDCDADDECS
jgi:hypothetical protein